MSALSKHEKNTFTGKEIGKNVSIIISIDGDDSPEISSLKNQKNSYLHLIFTIKHGKVEFLRMETSDKFGDKLSDICELIKNEPWVAQAIILYEVADLLDKGIEYLKIPESVWGCTGKYTLYKQVVFSLLELQNPNLIADNMLGQGLSAKSYFAFVCGLWNGTVEIVQSVPQMDKLVTCVLHPDCEGEISSKWASFKRMQIYDDQGALLCDSSAYWCKVKELVGVALSDLVADDCKVAHTIGSVVGPVVATCVGDGAAAEAVIARLGKVGSGLKYTIKGLQLCDKITNIPGLLAKGLKVSAALVKKAGKLLPEIRIGGKTVLHYVGDKLHIRRFDAVTKQTIDEPVDESNLSKKIEEALERGKDATNVGKYSLASISKEKGFIDLLPGLLGKDFTIDDFRYMMLKRVNALTESEKATLARIRNAIPKPDANTLMQKVIPKDVINMYLREVNPYTTVGGFVTRASDAKHLKTYDDIYWGLRLDYVNDGGRLMNYIEDGSCGVIRFKTKSTSELSIPREELLDNNNYPYTGHGFTSGKQGRIGVPEFKFRNQFYAELNDGAELYEVFSDGREVLKAIFSNKENKFIPVK